MRQEIDAAGVSDVDVAPPQSSHLIPSQSSDIIPIPTSDISTLNVSTGADVTAISNSPSKTVVATRCAKVLEKLINATFMVENADKLAELEQKANDLLQATSSGIKDEGASVSEENQTTNDNSNETMAVTPNIGSSDNISLTGAVPLRTINTTTATMEEIERGQKHKLSNDVGDGEVTQEDVGEYVPVTQSIEYVNVPGVQPSIVYTYGTTNNKIMYL